MVLYIDIETYSSVDLPKCGVYKYAASPDFEIIMIQWAYDDDPVQVADTPDTIAQCPIWFDTDGLKVAHNAAFERVCFSAAMGLPVGQYLDPEPWEDTAAMAAEAGLPRSLDKLAKYLGVAQKDSAGAALINWFCKPDRSGNRRRPEDHPEKWEQFKDYGRQDVVALRDVHRSIPGWQSGEREIYMMDQEINDRGLAVDLDMCAAADELDRANRDKAGAELREVLGINNAGSVVQITEALLKTGLEIPNLRAETVDALLAQEHLTPQQEAALQLRKSISLVAAAKYSAALRSANDDGRLRGQYFFHGAHTGRWSSRGVQIHNLANESLVTKEEEKRLSPQECAMLAHQRIEMHIMDMKLGIDPGPEIIKALVRSMFVGPYAVMDYSAIEARGLAWLAGETWVLDAFRAKRDIYVETAKRMGGLTRQQGKIAVLALGYNGGVNSLRGMGAQGDDEELQDLVNKYREANPRIKRYWRSIERAFAEGGEVGRVRVTGKHRDRYVHLPSGRILTYHNVKVSPGAWQGSLHITFDDPKGYRTDTYGGRLAENIVQAVSRDLLADAMLNLTEAGFTVVGHTHDEAITENPDRLAEMKEIMEQAPAWADGLPIDVEGFTCARYRK